MPLLADVYNNTRTWTNRGYSAKEISEIFNENASLVTSIPVNELDDLIFKKLGRNDPCPCGSGKKYKKCCAR
ncbi:MAG: SEC-C metal-binding domain-containing protein [Candidatus Humimicrobiaceae bacterium]